MGSNRNGYCLCGSDCVFLIGYLLACGSVEPNPGPEGENEDSMKFASGAADSSVPAQSNQAFLDRLHADMAHTLHQALLGTETVDQQQGRKIEGRPRSVQDKIDRRLYELEVGQTRPANRMDSLNSDCQALRSENQDIIGTVNYLTEKCDCMENQNRRNN